MAGKVLRLINGIYGFVIEFFILALIALACYSIWDNSQIYRAAEIAQEQIRQLKPEDESGNGPGFDELRKVNEDVVGWISIDGTNIDYPVLQGINNLEYMNKDVYGEFSLAGSLFLDSRNNPDFKDNYSLIYGHNMDEHLMFGDLALFKDKDFFAENTEAQLMLPDKKQNFKVAAVLQISAGTDEIFNPDMWKDNLNGFGEFLRQNSIWFHSDIIQNLISRPDYFQVIGLATCSDGSTNDRTVLIIVREKTKYEMDEEKNEISGSDKTPEAPEDTSDSGHKNDVISGTGPKPTGDSQNTKLWIILIAGTVVFIAAFEIIEKISKRNKK